MKTAMKKVLSLVMALVLLVGVLPFQAFAEEVDPATADAAGTPDAQGIVDYIPCNVCLFFKWDLTYDHHDWDHCAECYKLFEKEGHTTECSHWACDDCGKNPCVCNEPVTPPAPTPDPVPATVEIIINNAGTGNSLTVEPGLDVYAVYAAFKNSSYAAQYDGANGPILTLAESSVPVAATEAGNTYWLWMELVPTVVEPTPEPEKCEHCQSTEHATADCPNNMCPYWYADKGECVLCEVCKECVMKGDHKACTTPTNPWGKTKLTLDYNYFGDKDTVMDVDRNANLLNVIAGIPAPTRDGYLFSAWTLDREGNRAIGRNDKVSDRGTTIYAQWDKIIQSDDNYRNYDIRVNLNYDRKMGETIKGVAKGTKMADVLNYVNDPYRWGYKFAGWYWDANCKNDVEWNDKVLDNCTIYAKWEHVQHETMLKIYINGDTKSAAKIVDLHAYAKDGKISMNEVKEVVAKYYTAKDSDGLSYYGLFDSDNWNSYVRNHKHNGAKSIDVKWDSDTTVYVMVHNAKVRTSATADSTNPKTGDMIMMPAMVLGLSASALAVLFYLNKKRAV